MPNLLAGWWSGVTPRVVRRKSVFKAICQVENLEARVVLSRGTGFQTVPDAAALVAVEPQMESPPVDASVRSAIFHVPSNARKSNVIDIKQWQGTWNVTTDIPFLGNGTLQIRQLAATKFEATTTGMSGNQFFALKATGDSGLHFKIKGTDFEGKPRVAGFQVELNTTTLKSFQGIAKVVGGNHPHSISATLQNGTAPVDAEVRLAFFAPTTTAKSESSYDFTLILGSLGQAAIPDGGVHVLITFTGQFGISDFERFEDIGRQRGFSSVTPSINGQGQLVLTCVSEGLVSKNTASALGRISLKVHSSFSFSATLVDPNGGTAPNFPLVTSPVVNVEVN